MKNRLIAEMFEQMADVLEFKGEIPFKVNAYRKASRVIKELQIDIENLWKENKLNTIPGVGTGLAKKIDEFLKTGRMTKYEEIVRSVPPSLIDLLKIQSLGPKTLALAHEKLNVETLEDLKRVIQNGTLAQLPGMGEKKVENILKGIQLRERGMGRIPLGIALPLVEEIIEELKKLSHVGRIYPAGSVRRMRETVGDIDILVETDNGEEIVKRFVSLPNVTRVLAAGKTKGSVLVENNIQVDLRAVESNSYGAALQYFTGSKAHNIRLREIAKKQGLKINEYGVFDGEKNIGGEKEEDIYHALGLTWIPPELREDRGEIEAAAEGNLPQLITLDDINGDFHVHTKWSDGAGTIEQVVAKAEELKYSFVVISDHSQSAGYANGLTPERLLEQIKEIKRIRERTKGLRVLAGTEVDIRADGSLDFPDDLLKELDIVIAAVHSGFKQKVTERLIAAARNPYVTIIAHPTGRIISQREGYQVDLEKVMKVCAETSTALEINSYYERLDLNDINARKAKEMGIKLAIGTDAHHPDQMYSIRLGLGVARRAWIEKKDLLNSLSKEKVLQLKRKKKST